LGARWRRLSTGAKVGYISATLLTVVAVGVSLFGYSLYLHLNANISTTKVSGLTGRSSFGVQNVLILGSQTRDGQGKGFGYDPNTNLSDNLLLIHLDATHTHATVVSIPRDAMVYEPECRSRFNNQIVPANPQAIIDGAMNLGGPSCAVLTVEHLTGITMDHFVEFNFNSFRAMVNTLGGSQGIEVCLPQAVDDPYSNLHLAAGKHFVTGDQALAFVRTRHGVGTGTDLGRIELQQEFFSSLIQQIKSKNTLENPIKLYGIANTATQALTVDSGLGSVSKLLSLASTMRNLHTNNVTFITMPTVQDPASNQRLLPTEPQDDVIWSMLQNDQTWQGGLPLAAPSTVTVNVLNGTGIGGLARQAADRLQQYGYKLGTVGNASFTQDTTVSYNGPVQADAAYTLMGTLQQPPVTQNDGSGTSITLTIGANGDGVNAPPAPASPAASASAAAPSSPAAAPSTAPSISSTPSAGQQPNGTQLQIPGQATGIQTRNAAANICTGVPGANPNTGGP
jgi:LCP family protein required for cell wall assembly